jgi:hypothetical protein
VRDGEEVSGAMNLPDPRSRHRDPGAVPGAAGPTVAAAVAAAATGPSVVLRSVGHVSEDGNIARFVPRVAPSDPGRPPTVWAVARWFEPVQWAPRRCPRVMVWATDDAQRVVLAERFGSTTDRVCAVESGWLDEVRRSVLYRYEFDATGFTASADAPGEYLSTTEPAIERVVVLDDLLAAHAAAGVELRVTPRLGALVDQILQSGLPYRFVNLRDARR